MLIKEEIISLQKDLIKMVGLIYAIAWNCHDVKNNILSENDILEISRMLQTSDTERLKTLLKTYNSVISEHLNKMIENHKKLNEFLESEEDETISNSTNEYDSTDEIDFINFTNKLALELNNIGNAISSIETEYDVYKQKHTNDTLNLDFQPLKTCFNDLATAVNKSREEF